MYSVHSLTVYRTNAEILMYSIIYLQYKQYTPSVRYYLVKVLTHSLRYFLRIGFWMYKLNNTAWLYKKQIVFRKNNGLHPGEDL